MPQAGIMVVKEKSTSLQMNLLGPPGGSQVTVILSASAGWPAPSPWLVGPQLDYSSSRLLGGPKVRPRRDSTSLGAWFFSAVSKHYQVRSTAQRQSQHNLKGKYGNISFNAQHRDPAIDSQV